jgi:hypothetical protein
MTSTDLFFQKASTFANISYWGILLPPVGITLCFVNLSMLKELRPSSNSEAYEIMHVRRVATWGGNLSAWPLWLAIIAFVVGFLIGVIQGAAGNN